MRLIRRRTARVDDSPEAFEDELSSLDVTEELGDSNRQTRPYKCAEFLAGYAAGHSEGLEATVEALKVELVRAGCTEDEVKQILARVRDGSAHRR